MILILQEVQGHQSPPGRQGQDPVQGQGRRLLIATVKAKAQSEIQNETLTQVF